MSISVVPLDGSPIGGIAAGSRDIALAVEGLAITNLGPGRNRQFIRGVADSPFNGASQSTVAVQLDEARITFDAPDPDLRLIDMQRIEILKGPQGPLYGSGALGGIYHIVTRKPDLSRVAGNARILGEATQRGGLGTGGEAVLNLPLVEEHVALRAVGYSLRGGGWIDNIGRNRNANVSRTFGARVGLRWKPNANWTIDVGGTLQNMNVADSQYVTESDDTVKRNGRIPEPADNDFRSISGTIEGRIGKLRLLSATSFVDHGVDYTLDSTTASTKFGLAGNSRFQDDRVYHIFNQELRLSPVRGGRWVAGISILKARSHNEGVISAGDQTPLPVETLDRLVTEYAIFGEVTQPLFRRVSATLGARLFRTIAENEATEQTGGGTERIAKNIVSPSLSLSWTPASNSIVYLRYARALRPGGLAPSGLSASRRFDADELGTIDLGVRHEPSNGSFALGASVFYTIWNHIQSDYLLANGLVSTRNAGKGRIYGAETTLEWRVRPGLRISSGFSVLDAMLLSTEDGLELDDRRLPIAPDLTGRLAVRHDFKIGGWSASLAAQGNYVGRARLALDQSLDRQMGGYATVATSAALARSGLTLSARVDNLLDIQGDSFAFGNPFSIMEARQYTPLRPRTFTLTIGRAW